MSPETLKEAKNFKTQMLVCSIICWLFIGFFAIMKPEALAEVMIVPIGGIILTIIYFRMKNMIDKYEKLTAKK